MKKVLISGCTGQDGSYMAEYLINNTDNTLVLAARRTSQAILSNIQHLLDNPRVKLITLDLMDSQAIRQVIKDERPDYFINLGAQTFVSDSWNHPEQHMQINALSLIHILEAVREYSPDCRVYSAGSSEQFGDVKYSPQDINHPYSPRSMYGVSKCSAAMTCKVYRESYKMYVVHGILYNHESERRQDYFVTRKITKGVARIKKALESRKKFEPIELGNVNAKRDWSHAEDFVEGIWMMLNQEYYSSKKFSDDWKKSFPNGNHAVGLTHVGKYTPKEYILSSDETHSIKEFIQIAFEEAGIIEAYRQRWDLEGDIELSWSEYSDEKDVLVIRATKYNDTQDCLIRINPKFYRPADVELLLGNSEPARKELGWEPKVSFEELVRRMVKHDLAQE